MKFTNLELELVTGALINHKSSNNFVELFEKNFSEYLDNLYTILTSEYYVNKYYKLCNNEDKNISNNIILLI